jgi:hypothetical protein
LQPEDKNPDVSNLDDGQLKALLDEAITYKRPKDREGKSDLFRVSESKVYIELSVSVSMLIVILVFAFHFKSLVRRFSSLLTG